MHHKISDGRNDIWGDGNEGRREKGVILREMEKRIKGDGKGKRIRGNKKGRRE